MIGTLIFQVLEDVFMVSNVFFCAVVIVWQSKRSIVVSTEWLWGIYQAMGLEPIRNGKVFWMI